MTELLALSCSPRDRANSEILLDAAVRAAREAGAGVTKYRLPELSIRPCRGCLRCNTLGRCATGDDDWPAFSRAFVQSDAVLIACPVYFRHVPGPLKTLMDRFRSLIKVSITRQRIICVPREYKPKNFGFILTQGEPAGNDFEGALQMLKGFAELMGRGGACAGEVVARGVALSAQVAMPPEKLAGLFARLGIAADSNFVRAVYERYQGYLAAAADLGARLAGM